MKPTPNYPETNHLRQPVPGGVVRKTASATLLLGGVALLFAVAWAGRSFATTPSAASSTLIAVNNGDVAGLIAAIQTLNSGGGGTIPLAPDGS